MDFTYKQSNSQLIGLNKVSEVKNYGYTSTKEVHCAFAELRWPCVGDVYCLFSLSSASVFLHRDNIV